MDKETQLMSRLAANHLHLGQFEPLRATLLALRARNPDLALSILQTIVAHAGRFGGIKWSVSFSSPPLLTFMSTIELLKFNNSTSPWGFDEETLRLRVDFVLTVQLLLERVARKLGKDVDVENIGKEEVSGAMGKNRDEPEEKTSAEPPESGNDLIAGYGDLEDSARVLNKVLELGINRLKVYPDGALNWIHEAEYLAFRGILMDYADLFDALCCNIEKQLKGSVRNDSGMVVSYRREGNIGSDSSDEDNKNDFALIQRSIQLLHLDAMKEYLRSGDEQGAVARIRFLHLDHGVEKANYRAVLQDILLRVVAEREGFGDAWLAKQERLLLIYVEALSSNCKELVQLVQVIQDDLLLQNTQACRPENDQIPPPLDHLEKYLVGLNSDQSVDDRSSPSDVGVKSCMRDMFHYARVFGLHMLECVVNSALSAVKKERLQNADYILALFPRLRPLVASMGWDLLSGRTTARRNLMKLLWTSNSQAIRLQESSFYEKESVEMSCVEHLCDMLCYRLDLASFVACVNSGKQWNSKSSLLMSGKEQLGKADIISDPFVENFVLERLSAQSPLRVLFDVVPSLKYQDAIALISLQPIASDAEAWKRMKDIELMHMRYALDAIVLGLEAMEKFQITKGDSDCPMALCHLKDLSNHLEAIKNVPRKIMMANILISLLHIDEISLNPTACGLQGSFSPTSSLLDHEDFTSSEQGNGAAIHFMRLLLNILRCNLPSSLEEDWSLDVTAEGRQALKWRISVAERFTEDCEWKLSVLQQLLPLSERQWSWKEALSVLRAAPSKLFNLCMRKAKYDIGEQAVHRFSLSVEDKATLELAEWVDNTFRRASVEDAMSRAAEGISAIQDLDLPSLCSQLGPLAAILLCMDIAAASAKSSGIAQQLLDQSQGMLSKIYPGGSPKVGYTYWDQVHEMATISVSRRVLRRLLEFVDQGNPVTLQALLVGDSLISSATEYHRKGQRERALAMLHQMIEDAHMGKRQFLSGKLHNLARAIADEESGLDFSKGDGSHTNHTHLSAVDKDCFLGLGLKVMRTEPSVSGAGDASNQSIGYDIKDAGRRLFGPSSNKPMTYLSEFILHIAAVGDIVDGTDTTHDFNFFSLVYEWPKDLLTRLVFDRSSTDAAARVAEIMSADFVHEMVSACVCPIYPPRSGRGWACVPIIPACPHTSSESKVLSPSSREAKPNCYKRASSTPGVSLYPLQLDVVKHLVKISPVRAVLACVFGSSILYKGIDSTVSGSLGNEFFHKPDSDRLFYEFALDQSERFPSLNRWIQMQTNLHRVSEFAVTITPKAGGKDRPASSAAVKRLLEHDSDSETEVDEISGISVAKINSGGRDVSSCDSERSEKDSTVFLSFDWENEVPYKNAVERLIGDGKLMDALALSDRFLRNGASDQLLQLLIEQGEENSSIFGEHQGCGSHNICSNSWQYCLRLKDKKLAARLTLKYMKKWELEAALSVLTMCACHLPQSDPLTKEVLQKRQALLRYNRILNADDQHSSWQEVEAEFKGDSEGLALRLAGKGAVSAALEVAESAELPIGFRIELQGRQLVKLLTTDPLSGGGPAEASRFLSSLHDSSDALPVVMEAMQSLPDLRSKQLLVHFFLKRRDGSPSDAEISKLNSWALGLRILAALPLPWQQRCSSLHEHPQLILEVLLMRKQLDSASLILKEFPQMRDNNLIVAYATKAVSVSITSHRRESRILLSGAKPKPKGKVETPKSSFTRSLSNLPKEALRAFSRGPKTSGDKTAPKDGSHKRKFSGLPVSERVAWEELAGVGEDHVSSYSADGQDRLPSVTTIAEEWMLTGDVRKDEVLRASHKYESAPDIVLFKTLLSLCSDELMSAKSALDLCINQMKDVLNSKQLHETATVETIGRAYHATETFVQGLLYAKSLLKKLVGTNDAVSYSERSRDGDDTSSDAGSSSLGSQSTDELSELFSQADIWLGRAELLQSLLGSGIAASVDDIADRESSTCLRDRLITDERYSMAVYTCKKCKIDVFPVWKAWGYALLRMERYAQARVKFKQAFQFYKREDVPDVILEIISTIEGGPPVDVSTVRSMYDHLARSAPTILDDSLSADSYLNVLYMPSTFPRSEMSRRSMESQSETSVYHSDFENESRSNLDNIRYTECVNYLQEYARQHLLSFMFRHGHYNDACMLFFPPNGVPLPPQPSSTGTSTSSSPQRMDPLATDYGTIENLCDFCVGYGSMSALEEVLSARMLFLQQQDQVVVKYTSAAIGRICNYCENHRHFNHLYKLLVIKKDHVTAGLCCIQLFMNSQMQDEAIRHLEHAKLHFDEGLTARHKGADSAKLVAKGVRGKSASEKLSEEELVKLASRVSLQIMVVRSFSDSEGPPWKRSLFGNPNDPETSRRRNEIAEILVERNFELAFQVISEFKLPDIDIYAAVAASFAEKKKGHQLTELFRNIRGWVQDEDWDQVLGAAINVYANKHRERPDRLVDMLISSHRKVLACVVSSRLKRAFQIASSSGTVADVQYVAHQALHANNLAVLDMCKQWLAQYM